MLEDTAGVHFVVLHGQHIPFLSLIKKIHLCDLEKCALFIFVGLALNSWFHKVQNPDTFLNSKIHLLNSLISSSCVHFTSIVDREWSILDLHLMVSIIWYVFVCSRNCLAKVNSVFLRTCVPVHFIIPSLYVILWFLPLFICFLSLNVAVYNCFSIRQILGVRVAFH